MGPPFCALPPGWGVRGALVSALRYPHCKTDLYCEQSSSSICHAFGNKTVGAFDWFLFRVLHTGPRKFKSNTRTSGIDAFRESHGTIPRAGSVVVVDYRTHLHVIQSNAPKLINLHPSFIYLSLVSAFRHTGTKAFR